MLRLLLKMHVTWKWRQSVCVSLSQNNELPPKRFFENFIQTQYFVWVSIEWDFQWWFCSVSNFEKCKRISTVEKCVQWTIAHFAIWNFWIQACGWSTQSSFPLSIIKILQNMRKIFGKRRIWNYYLLCEKPALYLSTMKAHVTEKILKLTLIHGSVISQILWILWILWKFFSI